MKFFLLTLIIIASLVFSFSNVLIIRAITCVPGDVYLNDAGDVVSPEVATKCLYGSDIAENRGFGGTITDPRANIRMAINIAMGFLGILVVGMIIYGGVLWLTAGGKEDQITKGKHVLMWAAIGGIVISIAWTITSYILQIGKTVG
jgi:hypothetical protein